MSKRSHRRKAKIRTKLERAEKLAESLDSKPRLEEMQSNMAESNPIDVDQDAEGGGATAAPGHNSGPLGPDMATTRMEKMMMMMMQSNADMSRMMMQSHAEMASRMEELTKCLATKMGVGLHSYTVRKELR